MNSKPIRAGDIIEVSIESLAFGGEAVARHEGLIVFVEGPLPGERAKVRITESKKSFSRAELIQVLEPSPHRRVAPCKVFGICGGCQWQHLEYSQQGIVKKDIIESFFKRHLKLSLPVAFHSAPHEFHYRNRVQVRADARGFAYKKKHSSENIYFDHCWIARPEINEYFSQTIPKANAASTTKGRLEVAVDRNGKVTATPTEYGGGLTGFGQVNSAMNEILQARVVEKAASVRPKSILELYCGNGNFSFPLLATIPGARFVGIESHQELVDSALRKAALDFPDRGALFLAQSAEMWPRFIGEPPDLLVVDPPRFGLDETVRAQISAHLPKNIIYISCDPATLTRDLRDLTAIYNVTSVEGFDMFPQTSHLEVLVSLELNG